MISFIIEVFLFRYVLIFQGLGSVGIYHVDLDPLNSESLEMQ